MQLKKRWEEIGPYYADLVDRAPEDIRPFMPNLHDACLLPCLAVLASAADLPVPVTSTWFAAVEQQLLSEARGYVSQAKRDLVGMLHRERQRSLNVRKDAAQPMPEYTAAQIDAELSKATSLFVCPSLWCRFDSALSAWDICTHWRTAHPKLKWNDRWPRRGYEDLRNRCRSRWVQQPWINAMRNGEEYAQRALAGLGLPEDTSHAVLDALVMSGRIVCKCGNPMLAPAESPRWATMVGPRCTCFAWGGY